MGGKIKIYGSVFSIKLAKEALCNYAEVAPINNQKEKFKIPREKNIFDKFTLRI